MKPILCPRIHKNLLPPNKNVLLGVEQGSLELVDFHISNSDAQWWRLGSWHLSMLSTNLFSSQFKKKPGLSCVWLCGSTWHSWLQYSLLVDRKFHLSPRGFSDHSHQHHLIWQKTKTLFRTKYFTCRQLYLSHRHMSSLLVSTEMESCMQRTMVSMILQHKYRRIKGNSKLVLLWLTKISLQFLFPFTGGTYGASRWN